jgi:antitoxin component of MazEF toxin-antitoxin module
MRTKLVKHGDDYAVIIDQSILDRMGIDAETELEISVEGNALIVTPLGDAERRKKFRDALEKVTLQYDKVFKRLAE